MSETSARRRPKGLRRALQERAAIAEVPEAAEPPEPLEVRAARASFDEDHSLGKRWEGRSRVSESIPHSYGGTGRNWVD